MGWASLRWPVVFFDYVVDCLGLLITLGSLIFRVNTLKYESEFQSQTIVRTDQMFDFQANTACQ